MDEVLDDDIGLAEPEHLETMFEALEDTLVAGTESLTLSSAQSYALTVLRSSGAVTHADLVTGNEGFFSTLGNGATKIWEYIKKMFQGIWNWFFGKKEKGPSITEQTDSILKANQASLKAWAHADATNSLAMSQQFRSMTDALDEFMNSNNSGDQNKAREAKAALMLAHDKLPKVQAQAIKDAAEVVVKLNSRTQRAIEELCKQGVDSNMQYLKLVEEDHSDKFAGTVYADEYKNFREWSKGFEKVSVAPYLNIPKGMTKLEHAERAQGDLIKVIGDIKLEIAAISSTFKTSVITKIKKLEEILGRKDLAHGDKFRKDLTACKIFLGLTTRHIKQLERTQELIKRLSNMIMRLFGLRAAKA